MSLSIYILIFALLVVILPLFIIYYNKKYKSYVDDFEEDERKKEVRDYLIQITRMDKKFIKISKYLDYYFKSISDEYGWDIFDDNGDIIHHRYGKKNTMFEKDAMNKLLLFNRNRTWFYGSEYKNSSDFDSVYKTYSEKKKCLEEIEIKLEKELKSFYREERLEKLLK